MTRSDSIDSATPSDADRILAAFLYARVEASPRGTETAAIEESIAGTRARAVLVAITD